VVAKPREPAHQRPILREQSVSVQLAEVCERGFEIVLGKTAFRMPRDFDAVLFAVIGKNLSLGLFEFFFD